MALGHFRLTAFRRLSENKSGRDATAGLISVESLEGNDESTIQ